MAGFKALTIAALGLLAAGCAGTPSPEARAANDPYEVQNRKVFALNAKIDQYVVAPSVGVYFLIVPDRGRRMIHNLLGNVALPTTFVNDVLQAEPQRAWQTFSRLAVNTTVGVGGLFDVATGWGIPGHGEDFGQTLAVWGVGEGPYWMLPFFGPSNPRDAFGQVADIGLDPTNYIPFKQHIWWVAGREYMTLLDLRGETYDEVQDIQRGSVDYYASMRSLYRQLRDSDIRNGRPAPQSLPDF